MIHDKRPGMAVQKRMQDERGTMTSTRAPIRISRQRAMRNDGLEKPRDTLSTSCAWNRPRTTLVHHSLHLEEPRRGIQDIAGACGAPLDVNANRDALGEVCGRGAREPLFHRDARGLCTLCGKSYAKLKLHYLTVHAHDKKVQCTYCQRFFASASQRKLHVKQTHEKAAKLVCDLCGYVCSTKQAYEAHMAIHQRTVHCRACDFAGDRYMVETHMKEEHMKDGKYVCPVCQKTFVGRQKSFTPHLRNSNCRTSLRFYKDTTIRCKSCSSTFVSDARLRIHMKVHDLQDEGFCKICNKRYKRLLIHSRSNHKDEAPYKCEWCSNNFKFQREYRKHMENEHSEFHFSCKRCGYRSKDETELQAHADLVHLESKSTLYNTCDKNEGRNENKSNILMVTRT